MKKIAHHERLESKFGIAISSISNFFTIHKKLKKTGYQAPYEGESMPCDGRLQFFICPFLICGDLLYRDLFVQSKFNTRIQGTYRRCLQTSLLYYKDVCHGEQKSMATSQP